MKNIILALLFSVVCISCETTPKSITCDTHHETGDIISTVETGRGYRVLKDNETGCEYLVVYAQGPNGGVYATLMYDNEGKPKTK